MISADFETAIVFVTIRQPGPKLPATDESGNAVPSLCDRNWLYKQEKVWPKGVTVNSNNNRKKLLEIQ